MYRLTGERIILREYREEDFLHIRKWVNDYEITKFLTNLFLYPHSVKDTENFIQSMMNGEMEGFVIAHKDTEEYIGQIDLIKIDWLNRIATMGIVIGNKENLSKGYGSEAIKLLQGFIFNKLNLNKLTLDVRGFNERAIACYEKCGFKVEGVIRDSFFDDGRYFDTVQMGILKREWKNL